MIQWQVESRGNGCFAFLLWGEHVQPAGMRVERNEVVEWVLAESNTREGVYS